MANKNPNTKGLNPFKKGITGNPFGRPKQVKPIKPLIERLLEKVFPSIEVEMKNGSPEVRREFFKDLTKIVLTANI